MKYLRPSNLVTRWTFLGFAIGCILMLVVAIAWQTLTEPMPHIKWSAGEGIAWQTTDSTVFEYWRPVVVQSPIVATIHRRVDCEYDGLYKEFDLPQLVKEYKPTDPPSVHRLVQWPALIPVGTKCHMHTYASWLPYFSMVGHQVELSPIDFVVKEKP